MDISPADSAPADLSPSTTVSSNAESAQGIRSLAQPALRRSESLIILDAGNEKVDAVSPSTDDDDEDNLPQTSSSTAVNLESAVAESGCSTDSKQSSSGVHLLMGKGKGKEWTAPAAEKSPKQLLDLPVDVLREIINQVRHHTLRY